MEYAEIYAVTHAIDRVNLDSLVKGCEGNVIAPDGTYCPSVSYPAKRLTAGQRQRLAEIMSAKPPYKMRIRCDLEPRLGFVFVDARGQPVAELDADLDCGKWGTKPSVQGWEEVIGQERHDSMRGLCIDLGFHASVCGIPFTPPDRQDLTAKPSGMERVRVLRDLSEVQQRHLCAWSTVNFSLNSFRSRREPAETSLFHRECPGTKLNYSVNGVEACLAAFPKCDVPVGSVEACFLELFEQDCEDAESILAICEPVRQCTWGLSWKP